MNCNTKSCKYYLYDECIRNKVTIEKGVCPLYSESELTVADVFHYPVEYTWGITIGDNDEVIKGHLLDAVVTCYNLYEGDYCVVRPVRPTLSTKTTQIQEYLGTFDMNIYLRFIDANIYGMYMEEFLLDYLAKSKYTVNKIDCSGQFVHLIVENT